MQVQHKAPGRAPGVRNTTPRCYNRREVPGEVLVCVPGPLGSLGPAALPSFGAGRLALPESQNQSSLLRIQL
jgi:hypothetical protein